MRLILLLSLAGLLLVQACSSLSPTSSTPAGLTPEAARARAQRDFAVGRPKIYKAGGYASYEPGITDREKALVARLPRDGSLAGCTNPNVRYATAFATAYNKEVVSLLLRRLCAGSN